jgi:trans-2,3-dihydro-3-hydroxyanthranilate isomerase
MPWRAERVRGEGWPPTLGPVSDAIAMTGNRLPVTIVNACLRGRSGGSPTAVLDETALSDSERCGVPVLMETSHAVFVAAEDRGHDGPDVTLRFFTATGELSACGHGTVAALAFLAERAGRKEFQATIRTSGRVFVGWAARVNGQFRAAFDPGFVDVRQAEAGEHDDVLQALGVSSDTPAPGTCVASLGRPRLLVPVSTRSVLAALAPDFDWLRDACDRLGLLGCYVYCVPTAEGRVTARMFAPSIGVPEDIANANSTACLAAYLAREGIADVIVDMGDALGTPSTITAAARQGEAGPVVHVGGAVMIARVVRL